MIHTPARKDCRVIYDLSLEFMDPEGAERAMKKHFHSRSKLQEKILLKDQLMGLRGIGTNEAQSFALKVGKKIKHNRDNIMHKVVKYIMNLKVANVMEDIAEEKENVRKNEEHLNKVVRPNTLAGIE